MLAHPLTAEVAEQAVRGFAELPVMVMTPALVLAAIRRSREERLSFWDGMIVEAALEAGATELLSEDMQDGRWIETLRIRNPFAT